MIATHMLHLGHGSSGGRDAGALLACCSLVLVCATAPALIAQEGPRTTPPPSDPRRAQAERLENVERKMAELTEILAQTQSALRRSQDELSALRAELGALRGNKAAANASSDPASDPPIQPTTDAARDDELRRIKEQQEILQAEVKQHEQTKIETELKYGLTVNGIALFNAYSNAGIVDDAELPALAYPRGTGSSHGSLGGSLRQTVLGIVASGPVIAGARTSASVNVDFFGGTATTNFGYTAAEGYVRMRDGDVGLSWNRSALRVGYFGPLISPLSPSSFATVAQPALAASGNLWIWSPQVSYRQNLPIIQDRGLSLEGGLISPPSPAYSSTQLDSPTEASRRPGVEGRVAFHSDLSPAASPRSLAFAVGAYSANQFYGSSSRVHSWAATGDWQIPLSRRADFSGEIYRGRALGGLGGGLYKDILSGTDPVSGVSRVVGVETAGGWAQLKLSLTSRWEANAMFGLDDAFSSSFHNVLLPAGSSALTLAARNSTVTGNLVFRPSASIIISPEYRRLTTWRINGGPYIANIFTLSAGYQF